MKQHDLLKSCWKCNKNSIEIKLKTSKAGIKYYIEECITPNCGNSLRKIIGYNGKNKTKKNR